jgi:hypothetical protein
MIGSGKNSRLRLSKGASRRHPFGSGSEKGIGTSIGYGFGHSDCTNPKQKRLFSIAFGKEWIMKQTNRTMLAVFSAMFLLFVGSLLAEEKLATMTLKGELISVNPDSQSFVVRDSKQKSVEFTYNDKTEVSGSANSIEGLSGASGHSVTIQYKVEDSKKIATKVEIESMHDY